MNNNPSFLSSAKSKFFSGFLDDTSGSITPEDFEIGMQQLSNLDDQDVKLGITVNFIN